MSTQIEAEAELERRVQQMFLAAKKGCGLVWQLCVERFSAEFDKVFPLGHPQREAAITLAEDVYATPEEIAIVKQKAREMGLCSHGLKPDYCPAGCGDL